LHATRQRHQPPTFDEIVEILQAVGNLTNCSTAAQVGVAAVAFRSRSSGNDCIGELGLSLLHQAQGWLSEGAPPAESNNPRKYLAYVPSRTETAALVHVLLGMVLKDEGHLDRAIEEYRKAIRLKPDFAIAHNGLGASLLDAGNLDAAALECREAIRLQPEDETAVYHLGNVLYHQGNFTGAIAQYREAIRLNPDIVEARNNLANALYSTHDLNGAIAEFRELIRRAPTFADAHTGLGSVLFATGNAAGAIREFREALRLKPASSSTAVHYNLANVLRETGAADDAMIEYREAVKLKPNFVDAHLNLGVVLADKGELDAAIGQFEEVLRLQPGHVLARQNLQRTISLKGRNSAEPEIDSQARKLVSEFILFKREISNSIDEYDQRKQKLLDRIVGLGADAVPALEQAIFAILDGFPSRNCRTPGPPGFSWPAFEFGDERTAGMLSETIGRIGGPKAFAPLERILSVRTRIGEYHRDIKPGVIKGLAYLAGADERAKRIVSEFAMENGCGLMVNPILERAGVKPVMSSDVIADEFLKGYAEKRQSLLDYVHSLASQNQKTKIAALYQASRRLQQIGEKQAALRGYLSLLHVDPTRFGGVEGVRDLLGLEKSHPLEAPMEELFKAAVGTGAPTARHKEIVQMIKEHVLQSDPDGQKIFDAVCQ
jgi:tetratricopeptide (TPR) repeat protein